MDMIGRQKALADRVYALLSEDYDILLAGGAPRDWHIKSTATDLDFYVYSENPENDVMEVSKRLEIELTPLGEGKYDRLFQKQPSLLAVYEGDFYGETVQFMFTSVHPKQFVREKFDLSICKVWYEHGEIGMDWEARLSFRENILVMEDGFTEHADRLMERDPWGGFAFMGSWRRALDVIAEMPAEHAVLLRNPVNGLAIPGHRREPEVLFIEEDQVPDPHANEVAF